MSFVNPTEVPDDWHPRSPLPSDTCPNGLHCTAGGGERCAYGLPQCAAAIARGWWGNKVLEGLRCSCCGELFKTYDDLRVHADQYHGR
jgi:hypothetical protein